VPYGETGAGEAYPEDAEEGLAETPERVDLVDTPSTFGMGAGFPGDQEAEQAGNSLAAWRYCPACGRPVDGSAGRSVRRALGDVLGSLSRLGFDAEWRSVRAADAGAPHKRERIFILACARGERLERPESVGFGFC